jgi:hypothetical protein
MLFTALTNEQNYQSFGKEKDSGKTKDTKLKSKKTSKPKDEDKTKTDEDNTSTTPSDTSTTPSDTSTTALTTIPSADISSTATPTALTLTTPTTTNKNSTPDATALTSANNIKNGSVPCEPTNKTCQPVEKPLLIYCPDGYHKSGEGVCKLYLHCDASKYNNCPPTICILNKDCPSGFTCSNGYNIKGINGEGLLPNSF